MTNATLPTAEDIQVEDLFDLDVRIELDDADAAEARFTSITCSSCYPTWCC
ncbi:FDLD family class I lanthipeptide [Streptacidiphilus rugosus]|uniref:FDLD family class I lanthipeptide n=1 Tax=Streptacidiphilus rugosus TaxID=405783 RepID=UPI000B1EF3A8|nr:FDLD family class I lanthipeptide [Streptacidiphilus rugosus]